LLIEIVRLDQHTAMAAMAPRHCRTTALAVDLIMTQEGVVDGGAAHIAATAKANAVGLVHPAGGV
jgi:hypothetical protein